MAKNIDFMGAVFPDVPSVKLPQQGGGLVSFTDVTDTTAIASDVASGKYFYTADGTKTVGTASGGITPSGTMSITSNGIYDIVSFASVDVNVSGGGGGITADDIAMHSISGAISGSASIIANYAFYSQAITKANFPNAIGVSQNAFCYCQSLVTVTMPNVTTLSASVFYGCYHLATVSMPNLQQIGMGAFYTCSHIETLSLPMVSFISNNAFKSCRRLMSLYLLSTSAVKLSTTAAFSSTPMRLSSYTGSFGSIYVPASLVDTYKSATNWSAFAERITAYEG